MGYRDFVVESMDVINRRSPPVRISLRPGKVGDATFGGIPLSGYNRSRLIVKSEYGNSISVYEYDLSLPPLSAEVERYAVTPGRNIIDLSGFGSSIVSFKLAKPMDKGSIIVDLS